MTRCSATGFLEWVRRISTFVHVDPTGASAIILGGSGYWEWQRLDAQGNLLAEATSVVAIDNQIWNIPANGIELYACVDCIAESNTIYNTYYGILMVPGNDPTFSQYDITRESSTIRSNINNNKFFSITSNVVFVIWPGAETGMQVQGNVYYSDVAPQGHYGTTLVVYQTSAEYQQMLQVQPASAFIP